MAALGGVASAYDVKLLCRVRPSLPKAALLEAMRRRCPGAEPADGRPDSGMLHFVHPGRPVQFAGVSLPAQTLVSVLGL